MKKMNIKYLNDQEALVSKAFHKKAVIFGTDEYKEWREYLKDYPEAHMVVRKIKRNPDKKTNKNLTIANMTAYVNEFGTSIQKKEFAEQCKKSNVSANPYQAKAAWFKDNFKGYDYYMEKRAEEAKLAKGNEEVDESASTKSTSSVDETTESKAA